MKNIAVFASGTGSNFVAIYDAIQGGELEANLALLVCDRPNAKVIEKAQKRNIKTAIYRVKSFPTKTAYETDVRQQLETQRIDLIVLAGYMRLIGPTLLEPYRKKIINVHPSLLPDFKGLDAVGQAMNAGVSTTGVTIHYVDEGMDTGQVIAQQELDISTLRTREEIETEIHHIEHQLYPRTIQAILEERQ